SPPTKFADDQGYGDPSLTVDGLGNFYFSSLYAEHGAFTTTGGIPQIAVWHGRFNGVGVLVWDPPVYATTTATDFLDKEWIAVDKECGAIYLSYTHFGVPGI